MCSYFQNDFFCFWYVDFIFAKLVTPLSLETPDFLHFRWTQWETDRCGLAHARHAPPLRWNNGDKRTRCCTEVDSSFFLLFQGVPAGRNDQLVHWSACNIISVWSIVLVRVWVLFWRIESCGTAWNSADQWGQWEKPDWSSQIQTTHFMTSPGCLLPGRTDWKIHSFLQKLHF